MIATQRLKWVGARRRLLFFGLTFLTSLAGTYLMYDILQTNGFTGMEKAGLALFFILFTWITGAFWTALIGFFIQLRGKDRAVIHPDEVSGRPLATRTAVLMPIYNEDTERVMAGLDVIWSSIKAHSQQAAFDLFILSDTRNPDIAAAEESAWRAFVTRHAAHGRIFYRRRQDNTGKKAGNVADFVRSWGGAYEFMIVLDADSIMTAQTLVSMAALMEAHPETGIVQALPLPVGRETLFARLIQFAARLNSLMLASGLAYWQLGEGNYWGHNAILRMKAFAEHCDLPTLPGRPPFGGHILSHDFVEAAFMRRAGFKVWLLADVGGSWEEVPSNIIDYAARDRRWAQGNLQHLGLLPMRGLHWLSRIHLITGVLSYASSPIWLVVLTLSSIIVCMDALQGFQYFPPGSYSLFPSWPEYRTTEIAALLSGTLFVLLMPKVLGMLLGLFDRNLRRGYGGGARLIASVLVEQVFSTLLAPAMMLFHTTFVVSILAGHPVSWNAQDRGDRGIGFLEALNRHKWQILLGLAWGGVIGTIAPRYIWWMLPILAGLVLSVPLTMLTSRASVGRWMKRCGLLLTPEETETPAELVALSRRLSGSHLDAPEALPSPGAAAPGTFVPSLLSVKQEMVEKLSQQIGAHVHSGAEAPVRDLPPGGDGGQTPGGGPAGDESAASRPSNVTRLADREGSKGASARPESKRTTAPTALENASARLERSSEDTDERLAVLIGAVKRDADGHVRSDVNPTVEALVFEPVARTGERAVISNTQALQSVASVGVMKMRATGTDSAAPNAEQILDILSVDPLPARMPLQMEAAPPMYLRPRDALTGLHRLFSSAWTP